MQMKNGTVVPREQGTPQGSPVSPVLANLFMHYAFDMWMVREHHGCPFERYADLCRVRHKLTILCWDLSIVRKRSGFKLTCECDSHSLGWSCRPRRRD